MEDSQQKVTLFSRMLENNANRLLISCKICEDILQDPVACSRCECTFCKQCIEEHVRNTGLCVCGKKHSQKTVLKKVLKQLAMVRIICPNSDLGCEVVLKPDEIESHLKKCKKPSDNNDLFCPHCLNTVSANLIDSHRSNCPYRQIKCSACEARIRAKSYSDHWASCPLRVEACGKCGAQMTNRDRESHGEMECLHAVMMKSAIDLNWQASSFLSHMNFIKSDLTLKQPLECCPNCQVKSCTQGRLTCIECGLARCKKCVNGEGIYCAECRHWVCSICQRRACKPTACLHPQTFLV